MRTANVTNLQFPAFPQMDRFRVGCHVKAPDKEYAICTRRAGHGGRHSSGGFRVVHFVWTDENEHPARRGNRWQIGSE